MKWKKFWIAVWIVTILAVFVVTLVNNRPYLLMGGSSSVAPVMEELMEKFPDNHKKVDYNYISSASSGALPRVESGLFGIGWLSKEYTTTNPNMFTFQMMRDGLVIVYNLKGYLKPGTILDFDASKVQELYLKQKSWNQAFPTVNFIKTPPPVQTYTRPNGSGTRDVFDQKCLGGTTFYKANTTDSSSAMLNLDPGSIGYSSFADLTQSNPNKIRSTAGTWERVKASFASLSGNVPNYHLWRPFTGLINKNYKYPQAVADILKWIYSDATNNIFQKFGPKVALNDIDRDNVNYPLTQWLKKYHDYP